MHNQMRDVAHGTPGFLSRHRVMVKMFEDELMSVSGGALTGLPYWDPTIEAGNPRGSVVLTPDYMGTANPGCIQDGPAAGWMMNDGRCVERGFRGGTWVSTTVVLASIGGLRSYSRLNTVLEGGFHSVVHNAIGGNMPDSTRSPWDPLFWMLHGGVDYYYAVWENNGNYGSYDGPTFSMGNFGHTDSADYQNRLCYRYDRLNQNSVPSSSQNPTSPATPSATSGIFSPTGSPSTSPTIATSTRNSASPTPTPGAPNSGDIVIPDFKDIPESVWQSFNIPRENIAQIETAYKAIALYLNTLKAQGRQLPSLETLRNFRLPRNVDELINGNAKPTEQEKSTGVSIGPNILGSVLVGLSFAGAVALLPL